ncbi:nitroreductase [Salinisphaera sp. PC39]|uniref:nitroreductase family protein n=1 Tax=Salinisphaera sp. PC39 TaxID=1304156 RepID=UPI00333F4314
MNADDAKQADADHAIHPLLAGRWSPYGFTARMPPASDLAALFEAARWAASSYNEQPWRYLVATRDEPRAHARLADCLVAGNRAWAVDAPVLALGVVARRFEGNGEPNRAAEHDLGAASASLTFEAAARGLHVHQMIGIEPETARQAMAIPDGYDAFTALAIGYRASPETLTDKLRERDLRPRQRRPQSGFVFGAAWGEPAPWTGD